MTARRTAEGRRGRRPLWTCHFRRGREGAAGDLAPPAAVAAASFLAGSVPFFQRAARQFAAAGLHTVGNGTVSGAALYDVAGFSPLAAAGILEAANGAVGAARARRAVLRSARGLPPDSRGATWARWRPARRSPGTTGPPGPGWAAQEGEVSFLRCAPPRRSWPRCAGSPRTRASTSRRSAQGWSRTPARRSPGSPGGGSRLAGRILAGGYRTLTNISPTMTEA